VTYIHTEKLKKRLKISDINRINDSIKYQPIMRRDSVKIYLKGHITNRIKELLL
jgi:hypothetical protein